MTDLLALTAELIDIPSESRREAALADFVEMGLRPAGHLAVERLGDTVVARTTAHRPRRLLLAGHLDTVPPFPGAPRSRRNGDGLCGLGAVDMKGGLAVLFDLARTLVSPAVDATFIFYPCEEIERRHNGLAQLSAARPDLLVADAAVLGEPTAGLVEAGCQGTLRAVLTVAGRRAHTSRPWTGVNAVHRLVPALRALEHYRPRVVVLEGCQYTEQLQAVGVTGGVAGNVVPDGAELTVNFRFAPDRDPAAAEAEVRRLLGDALDPSAGDRLDVVDVAAGAAPGLDHPLLAALVAATGQPPRAKVGWTDVATLAAAGVPAANFGPGDPLLAHTPDECVTGTELAAVRDTLARLLTGAGVRGDAGR
ncbi:MAG: succinyl-diaminopimelate desuccinylase [Acidimicrobiales bacterium]